MNKYLKTYIRNRDIILNSDNIISNIGHFELKYFIEKINNIKSFNDTKSLAYLISKKPELINTNNNIKPELFDLNEILIILIKQPKLYSYFKSRMNNFDEYEIYNVILNNSNNIKIIKDLLYKIKNIDYIENLMVYYPSIIAYFDKQLQKLDGVNIRNILYRNINTLKYLGNYIHKLNKVQIKELKLKYPNIELDIKYGKYLSNYHKYGQYYES